MTERLRNSLAKDRAAARERQLEAVRAAFARAGVPWEPRRIIKGFPADVNGARFAVSQPFNVSNSVLLVTSDADPIASDPIRITRRQALSFLRILAPAEDGQPFPPCAARSERSPR